MTKSTAKTKDTFHVQSFPKNWRRRVIQTAQARNTTGGALMLSIVQDWFAREEKRKNPKPIAPLYPR